MDKPILSICIPTANRPLNLKDAIDSIIRQTPFIEGQVEIVVSDNSEGNETKELIDSYNCPIEYTKNEANTYGINFPIVLSRGTGVYRKLANDTVNYPEGTIKEMVDFVRENIVQRPILLWKTYGYRKVEELKTDNFEDAIRAISFYSTWIGTYGIWEEESDGIVEDSLCARDKMNAWIHSLKNEELKKIPSTFHNGFTEDLFWQMRYLAKIYKKKNNIAIKNIADRWQYSQPTNKYYGKGVMKWIYYDYYMSILKEYKEDGLISDDCVRDLERDVGFSFFVNYMVDVEFPFMRIKYDEGETLIEDILQAYNDKTYYEDFFEFYQKRRLDKMSELPGDNYEQ